MNGEWINIRDKLPKIYADVLVIDVSGTMYVCSLLERDGEYYWEYMDGDITPLDCCLWWMPLPEPPREKKNDC